MEMGENHPWVKEMNKGRGQEDGIVNKKGVKKNQVRWDGMQEGSVTDIRMQMYIESI